MYDTLIINAQLINGLNEAPRVTRVAIREGRIAAIDDSLKTSDATEVIDGEGLLLTPGFIDPHASTGFGYFFPKAADHKLYQGITTEIFGNCGTSPAPIGALLVPTIQRLSDEIGFPFEWRSLSEYFDAIQGQLQFNIATLVGHSTLRGGYMENIKDPEPGATERMKEALAEAMDEGALGLSTGLIYAPGCFAEMEEIIELAKVAKEKGGIYASHIRNERDLLEEAVEEALEIGKAAGINVLVSHLKAAEQPNWGKVPAVLKKLEAFNKKHTIQAKIDVYPYTAVSTKLRAFIPKHLLEDGMAALPSKLSQPSVVAEIEKYVEKKGYDLEQMLVISNEIASYHAKTIADISKEQGISRGQAMAKVIHDNTEAWIVYHCIQEEDMDQAILWKDAMVCTDSWSYPINAPKIIGQPHPRSYGAFTTFLERYVLNLKKLDWPEAIYKITHLPATFFKLEGRGSIQPGNYADLVLLDPTKVKAHATYLQPKQRSEGVEYLWVNGKKTIAKGAIIDGANGGKVLSL
jgi:N-acyl-D-amino-acid deacylase